MLRCDEGVDRRSNPIDVFHRWHIGCNWALIRPIVSRVFRDLFVLRRRCTGIDPPFQQLNLFVGQLLPLTFRWHSLAAVSG